MKVFIEKFKNVTVDSPEVQEFLFTIDSENLVGILPLVKSEIKMVPVIIPGPTKPYPKQDVPTVLTNTDIWVLYLE